jgi:hypothetical protein
VDIGNLIHVPTFLETELEDVHETQGEFSIDSGVLVDKIGVI